MVLSLQGMNSQAWRHKSETCTSAGIAATLSRPPTKSQTSASATNRSSTDSSLVSLLESAEEVTECSSEIVLIEFAVVVFVVVFAHGDESLIRVLSRGAVILFESGLVLD